MGNDFEGVPLSGFLLIMVVDKALCYFEPVLTGGRTTATASFFQISTAANAVITKCLLGGNPSGGIASGIGRIPYKYAAEKVRSRYDCVEYVTSILISLGADGNLAVVLSTFDPANVNCGGSLGSTPNYWEEVIGGMKATTEPQVFGPKSDPAAKVVLPAQVVSSKALPT